VRWTSCRALACLGFVLVTAGCGQAVATTGLAHQAGRSSPSIESEPPQRSVIFNGIAFLLPTGWAVTRPHCGPPANHTVVIGIWTGSCPGSVAGSQAATTGVTLTRLYGRQYALSWPGHRVTWQGQPAWLARQDRAGITMITLSLPWLNAVVAAQSGDPGVARSLLKRVVSRPRDRLAVPANASVVFVQSLAGTDGDGQRRNARVTQPKVVDRLLEDLRKLRPVTSPARACNRSWWPNTAVLTVSGAGTARTYAVRFDRCGLVLAGTGEAGETSQRLESDIRRLVPNSGL
jgi:hypothetical protein